MKITRTAFLLKCSDSEKKKCIECRHHVAEVQGKIAESHDARLAKFNFLIAGYKNSRR